MVMFKTFVLGPVLEDTMTALHHALSLVKYSFEEDNPPCASYYQCLSDHGLSSCTLVVLCLTKPQSQSCIGFT